MSRLHASGLIKHDPVLFQVCAADMVVHCPTWWCAVPNVWCSTYFCAVPHGRELFRMVVCCSAWSYATPHGRVLFNVEICYSVWTCTCRSTSSHGVVALTCRGRRQFAVQVRDGGASSQTADQAATVVLRVARNKQTPAFSNLPSAVDVNQTAEASSVLFLVAARDADQTAPFNNIT